MIAKVEPLTPARALRGPFDYRLPSEMEGVGVGSMLVVPFGRRRLLGVVVELAERSDVPPERLVEPLTALLIGINGRYKTHAGIRITGLPDGDLFPPLKPKK